MRRDEVLFGVQEILRKTFDAPDLTVTDASRAIDVDGWDSLGHATVLVRVEKRFDVRLPDDVAASLDDVGELVDAILERLG